MAWYWQIYAPGQRIDKTDGRTAILSLLTFNKKENGTLGNNDYRDGAQSDHSADAAEPFRKIFKSGYSKWNVWSRGSTEDA